MHGIRFDVMRGEDMDFVVKLLISMAIIIVCTQIGRRFPSVSGLIATMPLVSVIILVWIYSDNPGNFKLMEDFTKAALWGIVPSILFFWSPMPVL